jgi:hypothetical protein
MNKPARLVAIAATLASQAAWLVQPAISAPTAPPIDQRVRDTERKQQMIRTQTQRLGEDLTSIITEFENNGMGDGEDVKVLRAIKGVLGRLSDKDMARVVELLGAARAGNDNDPTKAKSKVAEAFGGQKTIVVQLRQLLLEYQRQQELYELSLRFAQLANRQNGNLKEAKRLVRSSQGKSLDRFDENQKISLSVQKDEQTAIRDEAMGVINRLAGLAQDKDSSTAERLTQSLQAAQKSRVEESLRGAVEELKAANLYRAAGSQKTARDQLRELSRLVAPPKETDEILRLAAAELERIIIEQKQTITITQALPADVQKKNEEPFFEAEDKQGDVVDRTDMVQRDIEHVCPLASEQCKKAEDQMQEARSEILAHRRDNAVKDENQSVVHLEAALKLVLETLNKVDKREEAPKDKLAEAKQLKEKVAELKKEQEELKKETEAKKDLPKKPELTKQLAELSPKQQKLQDTARELQPQTAQESVPAADAIADAAREMGKAQAALDKAAEKKDNKLDQATAPQQAAIDNLARAEKMLDQQIAQLEQAKNDLDKLQAAREKVAELIKNEQKIEIATAKAEATQKGAEPQKQPDANNAKPENAAKPDAQKGNEQKPADAAKGNEQKPADAAKGNEAAKPAEAANKPSPEQMAQAAGEAKALAKAQEQNENATAEAAGALPQAGAEAATPLNAAKGDMQAAKGDLQKGDPAGARPDEKQAVANLEKAKDALDKKIGQLQEQLGQPADAAPANLADAIAKAQNEIGQAMQAQPAQPQPGQPAQGQPQSGKPQAGNPQQAQALQKTAQELANAAADAKAPAAVDSAIAQATDALAEAAGKAEAGDPQGTQAKANAAQDALAQAAAALQMAQQGASSTAQAKGQGQGQPKPGQGEGQAQGQGQGKSPSEGQGQGQAPSQSTAEGQGQGTGDRLSGHAAAADNGTRANVKGQGEFIKLPARDRNAIMQSRKESAPSEYAPAVEQYLRNLSDTDEK